MKTLSNNRVTPTFLSAKILNLAAGAGLRAPLGERALADKNVGVTRNARSAFTLTEVMIATGLFSLVVIGCILSHMTGLKLCVSAQAKLKATHTARAAVNRTRDEIRSAILLEVGNGGATNFSKISTNALRQGNALQIYPTGNTNNFVRYYLDASDQSLKRVASSGGFETIANYITNKILFAAEDYSGNVLTNDQNNRVIRMTLEFYQWEFASLNRGGGNAYDYYRVQTRTARRAIQ
jgi:hypothetical protein